MFEPYAKEQRRRRCMRGTNRYGVGEIIEGFFVQSPLYPVSDRALGGLFPAEACN